MSKKALELANDLKEDLGRRFATVGSVALDSDGFPYFLIGAGTAGSQSALVKIKPVAALGVNAIGLSQPNIHPHVAQLVLETSTIANVPLLTGANNANLMVPLALRGLRVELYMSANTNAVGVEDIVSGNLKATVDPDLQWKLMSSM